MDSKVFEKRTSIMELLSGKRIILVTHLKDIDGVSSAAIAVSSLSPEKVIFSDYGRVPALELLKDFPGSQKGMAIIFTDISLSEDASDVYKELFGKLKSDGDIIIWLDHHPTQEKAVHVLQDFADFAVAGEQNMCGAELLYEEIIKPLGLSSTKIETIKEMAHISDFNISGTPFDEKLRKATKAISSYLDDRTGIQEGLLRISKAIENDPNNFDRDSFVSERAQIYERAQKRLKDELANNTYIVGNDIVKAIVGFNTAGSLQSNDGCYFLLELDKARNGNANTAIYVKVKLGTCHIRVSNKSIDTLLLAQALNGNGHPAASAFPIPKDFVIDSKEGMRKFADFIDGKIKEIYKTEDRIEKTKV